MSDHRPTTPAGHRRPHHEPLHSRRDMLLRGGGGFGALALAYLLGDSSLLPTAAGAGAGDSGDPLAAKRPHRPAKAKSVIFLFMEGGPSQMDTFDPKPKLNELAGQPVPPSMREGLVTAMGEADSPILPSKRKWKRHGESGLWVSDWLPHTAECADDLTVIRSCVSDGINHAGGMACMNTGVTTGGRPSVGSWVTYGLGTENQNLPAYVVLTDKERRPVGGPRNWGAGFMPAVYQGTRLRSGEEPIPNLRSPQGVGPRRQRGKLDMLQSLNREHAEGRPGDSELEARIRSYELAFRMQAEAPEAVDLGRESDATKEMYGMDEKSTRPFGQNCLLARRLVERGVRFVQLYSGTGSGWDAHNNIEGNHSRMCGQTDKPVAGLLKDLKQRGLLEETLVIWGGEFGRTPMSEKGDGRDHNPTGFTMWMAGGGIPGGRVIGATDELGLYATDTPLHVHDLHSTILHVMGVDHRKLVYLHNGRPERIDKNEGSAFRPILG